jgi:hypothetical protein
MLSLPTLLVSRILAVGPSVPGAIGVGEELRGRLPASLIEDLDRIASQIKWEVLDPLQCAASDEDLAITVERVLPRFANHYISVVHLLLGFLHEDAERLSVLTMRSFRESEDLIRSSGPRWIGQAATLNALQGLTTVERIVKAAIGHWRQGSLVGIGTEGLQLEQWAKSLISYWMVYFAVHASLIALASGQPTPAKLDNVVALANRSNKYAVEAYHLSKVIGLLKAATSSGPVDHGDDEDIALADAGLDSYVEALRQDDRP